MLSIILPTYNEKDNLAILIKEISLICNKNGISHQMVIVDDNSPDGTGILADELSRKNPKIKVVHRQKKLGLASAIMEGVSASGGDYICIMDADLQHDPADIPKLYEATKDADIVLGSRHVEGGGSELGLLRRIISRGAALLAKVILGLKVYDPETGFSIIKRSVFQKTELHPLGFKINLEILFKSGQPIKEVPIVLRKRRAGKTKLGPSEFINYLRLLCHLRFKK